MDHKWWEWLIKIVLLAVLIPAIGIIVVGSWLMFLDMLGVYTI